MTKHKMDKTLEGLARDQQPSHGKVLVFCESEETPDQPCWGVSRWHGPASDGAVFCEGHYAEAEGNAYLPETPKKTGHRRVYLQRYRVLALSEGYNGAPPRECADLYQLYQATDSGDDFLVSFELEGQVEVSPEEVKRHGAGEFFPESDED